MKFPILISCLLLVKALFAQENKTDTLQAVLIVNKKTEIHGGVQHIDSTSLQQFQSTSLQQVLQLHSNVFVKNYGIGSLSTISMRGSSAAQTAVLWQGIPMNNAMTGITDFSTVSVSLFDDIKINYNGSTPNIVGGIIELNNERPTFKNSREIAFGIGYESLQNTSLHMSVRASNAKQYVRIKVHSQQDKNHYNYYNADAEHFQKLTHARASTVAGIFDYYYKIKHNKILSVHSWNTLTDREIPAATFEKESAKKELNSSNRFVLQYDYKGSRYSSVSSLGFIHDQLKYEDSLISFKNTALAASVPFTETCNFYLNRRQKVGIEYRALLQKLLSAGSEHLLRNSVAIRYEAEPFYKKLFVSSFIQKEWSNVFTLPLIAGINIRQKLFREHFLFASLASNFRSPTLNELFFTPGGNKNLKPETSNNLEGGIENHLKHGAHSFKATSMIYSRDVRNWIVWYGGSILTPHNIQRVWSRGLEMDLNYRYEIRDMRYEIRDKRNEISDKRFENEEYLKTAEIIKNTKANSKARHSSFKINVLYAYTLSTTKESEIANDYSIGKQIPYVPRYQAKINLGYTNNDFELSYVYAYTGYRFVTTDESDYLLPYNTHNVFTSYALRAQSHHVLLGTFKINNILNKSYESIVGRVMPGRNFSVGILYRFNTYR
ncbi:MAG: TonB-dependent receptor [Bacteroidetes bacterium]|nr:TonB-dependent receptor [Bacteroidota bacterium]